MTFVTKRELDLSDEEKAALLYLSRTLGMQDGYATITYDEAALYDALTPVVSTTAPPLPESVAAAQEEVISPVEVVSEEVTQESMNDEQTPSS